VSFKVGHIGVFDRNIGDNIALINLQRSFKKYLTDVQFKNLTVEKFWSFSNNIKESINILRDLSKEVDAIVVGGGGLLEYATYKNYKTHYKLPFNAEILKSTTVPVYFYGLGVNIFRGGIDYGPLAIKSIQETINGSTAFTVRNDGSFSKLKNWIKVDTSDVKIVPDPGLLHLDRFNIADKSSVTIGGIQPAFNNSVGINRQRFNSDDNLKFLKEFFKDCIYFPHTARDFKQLGRTGVVSSSDFQNKYRFISNLDSFLEKYKQVDYIVAMRGHGQMITIGMNIPGIYLSTQDKVRDFSLENGFEDYNVDIQDTDWRYQLEHKVNLLRQPNSEYLKKWYQIRHQFIAQCHEIDKQFFKTYFNAV